MLVGAGTLQATDEVLEIANVLGTGVAKALLGKAAVARRLSFCHRIDRVARDQGQPDQMMQDCDTLLMVGSSFSIQRVPAQAWTSPRGPNDIDGRVLGIRFPMEVNLVGDSAETLRALRPLLQRKADRGGAKRSKKTSPHGGRWSRPAR